MTKYLEKTPLRIRYPPTPLRWREVLTDSNLVPRVHWLFGQWEGASRDSGIMEKIYFFYWLIIKQRNGEPETYDNKTGSLRPTKSQKGI